MAKPRYHAAPSGRFVLRIDPGLHAALRAAAKEAGVSLNDWCARRLAAPGAEGAFPEAGRAVAKAAALLGARLAGVAVFGSWARREATGESDVDLLVVVEPSLPLSRALYRAWDEEPLEWQGSEVEPHFVNLPKEDERTGGLWAEVALDGVVLFERGLEVSRRLAAIRREIASGRIVRRVVHGQPYWAEAKAKAKAS